MRIEAMRELDRVANASSTRSALATNVDDIEKSVLCIAQNALVIPQL